MLEKNEKEALVVDLYIRVSTDRQANEGDSLVEQERELKRFSEFRGFKIRNILIERGKSAGNTNRPEYQKLLLDIREKKINAVVVKRLDRLSRSLLDFEQFSKLIQEKDVEFISLKENFDTTNAMGKAMLRVALVFAQLEREQTSERITDVMEFRASQGIYNGGNRPLGYLNIEKELKPHPKEKRIVEILFAKFLETRSTVKTATYLNETGYRDQNNNPFNPRRMKGILRNPVYIGKTRWKNNIYDGIHLPILSDTQFQRVQELFIKGKLYQKTTKSNAILAGILYCGFCGTHMSPSFSTNRHKVKYFYYRCLGRGRLGAQFCSTIVYVSMKKMDAHVQNAILLLIEENHFRSLENRILKYNQKIDEEIQQIEITIIQKEAKIKAIAEKKDFYLDSLISSPFLSSEREMIQRKTRDLEMEEILSKTELDKQGFKKNEKFDERINLTELKKKLITFKAEYLEYTPLQLRDFLREMISAISFYPDKLVISFKLLPWEEEIETRLIK